MSTPSPIDLLRQFVDPYDAERERLECYDAMMNRVNVLTESAWERRVDKNSVEAWLQNFNGMTGSEVEIEQLHALYLLSQFLYFGVKEIRVLLTSLYRDLYQIPLVQEIRQKHALTRDVASIEMLYGIELDSTKFLGVGNPSESGVHLLYYFRQENDLRKSNFLDASQILKLENGVKELRFPMVKKYVFLDDICGSGDTICDYADLHLAQLKQDHPQLDFSYHCIFATQRA